MANIDVGAEIMVALTDYTNDIKESVDEAVINTANELKDRIKADSPKRTKKYSKGWHVKALFKGKGNHRMVVHNATHYQLTHLLEHGHAKAGGTERVDAQPHIQPNEEWAKKELEKRITEALQ